MSRHGGLRASLATALVATVLLVAGLAHAGGEIEVRDIRFWSSDGYTRVVIDLSDNARFRKGRIEKPSRLYIDLKNTHLPEGVKKDLKVGNVLLRGIRASQFTRETVRVVLDLNAIKNYKVFAITDPPRLVVDIYGEIRRTRVRRVVVDAGHGGRDPGAMGPGKLKEKDVVLRIAKRLKRILESEDGYEVYLTRSNDRTMSLEERTVTANAKNADLFISVHTNAHRNKKVRGMETYLLNWTDDEQAIKVAARENMISVRRMKQARSELGIILASLELQNKRDESLRLAHLVQRSMYGTIDRKYNRVNDLGVKQALFYVLFGARMPSVLVEVSFITNAEEAKRLRSSRYLETLAHGIADGIKDYFKGVPKEHKFAMR